MSHEQVDRLQLAVNKAAEKAGVMGTAFPVSLASKDGVPVHFTVMLGVLGGYAVDWLPSTVKNALGWVAEESVRRLVAARTERASVPTEAPQGVVYRQVDAVAAPERSGPPDVSHGKAWLEKQMARAAVWLGVAPDEFTVSGITHAKEREPFYTVTLGAMAINIPGHEVDGRSAVSASYAARKLVQATQVDPQVDTRDPLPNAVYRVDKAPVPSEDPAAANFDTQDVAAWIVGRLMQRGIILDADDVVAVLDMEDEYMGRVGSGEEPGADD